MATGIPYRRRLLDQHFDQVFEEFPAVFLTGARATGKSTLARRRARSAIQLDDPGQRAAVEANPDAVLAHMSEPILIDEWHLAPEVLGAVKRSVDANPTAGRFIVTGSPGAQRRPELWPGTGRLIWLRLWPVVRREIEGDVERPSLVDRILADGIAALVPATRPLGLMDYVERILQAGFPELAWVRPTASHPRWLESYTEQVLSRDVSGVGGSRDAAKLRRYLLALAAHTADVTTRETLAVAAGVTPTTLDNYEALAEDLSLLDRVPAWWTNRLKRLTKAPKRYLVDTAWACSVGGVDADDLVRDTDMLRRIIDTFVAQQLRAEAAVASRSCRLHHLRQADGRHEADLVLDVTGKGIIAIEVKASTRVTSHDARHLEWMRDELGTRFIAGIVLHTGPYVHELGTRIVAAPISSLWT